MEEKTEEKTLTCIDPKLIGKGGEAYIIRCTGGDDDVGYVVKVPSDYLADCNLKNELKISDYLRNTSFSKPIVFENRKNAFGLSTKFGSENIIKYYDFQNINLNSDEVQGIREFTDVPQNILEGAVEGIKQTIMQGVKKCFAVIENCDEGDLEAFVKNHPEYISVPSLYKDMVYQIFSALVYLYNKKVCHWDIKPQNIFVKTNPNYGEHDKRKYIFKLADFGRVMLKPTIEIRTKLEEKAKLMNYKEIKRFIEEKSIKIKPGLNDKDIDILENNDEYKLIDNNDIAGIFESTINYTPPQPLTLTTFYRDIYAFVLTIFKILLKDDDDISKNFNKFQKERNNYKRLSIGTLASKKRENNLIFQYKQKEGGIFASRIIKDVLWKIARIVKDCEKKIIENSEYLYTIKPKTDTNTQKPSYFKHAENFIINASNDIYLELFKRLDEEVFNTRIGKTLKNIRERKIAAQTQKKLGQSTLGSQASSNNNFEPIFEVPENIEEDLLGNHVVFVNSSVLDSYTHRNHSSGQNSVDLRG